MLNLYCVYSKEEITMKNIRTKAEEKARFLLRHTWYFDWRELQQHESYEDIRDRYFNSDDPDLIELALNMDVGY